MIEMTSTGFQMIVMTVICVNLMRYAVLPKSQFYLPQLIVSSLTTLFVWMTFGTDPVALGMFGMLMTPLLLPHALICSSLMLPFFVAPLNNYASAVFIIAQGLIGLLDWALFFSPFTMLLNVFWFVCIMRYKVIEKQTQYVLIEQADMKKLSNDSRV